MGAVYRARDMHFPNAVKLVAIKEMVSSTNDVKTNEMMIKNFEREANLLVTLSHPSITNIYDYFSIDQRAYLVIEYIYGKDLERILDRLTEFIPEEQVIKWGIQLCDVLEYLHAHEPEPIIFRDIKPSNVMINRQGNVVLIDFGIAKTFQTGHKGTIIGTEGYAPPEQYRGEATPAVDIYALGATLHHLLTRHDPTIEPPFTFDQRKIMTFNPSVSPELVSVVEKALSYDPSERWASAKEMKEALIHVGHQTGLLSTMDTLVSRTYGKDTPARIGLSENPDQLIKPVWTFKCEDEIRGSAALGNQEVYVGAYDNNLYKISAADGKFVWKFPSAGGIVTQPTLGADLVYFGSEDGKVYAIRSTTGKEVWSLKTNAPVRCSPVLAEEHVFIGSDDCNLYVIHQETGRVSWKIETMAPIRSKPVVKDDRVIIANTNGEMVCTSMVGTVKWRFNAKRSVLGGLLIDDDGGLFFSSLDSTFYALDAKMGWPMWRFRMEKGSVSTPVMDEKFLYFGSADGSVYCVNKTNGKLAWSYSIPAQVSGSPASNKTHLFIGGSNGMMYCLQKDTGTLDWTYQTNGAITCAPVIHNDLLIFGSVDKNMYALLI